MASRAKEKAKLRQERERREREHATTQTKKRKMAILAGSVAVAAAVVFVLIGISQGVFKEGRGVEALKGIPQKDGFLGKQMAPVTVVEFADLQCPVCADFTINSFPDIAESYIKSGKVKMELVLLGFLGPDSITAAKAALAAQKQGFAWDFVELFYQDQGAENSGYVTDDFLEGIVEDVPGLDQDRWQNDRDDTAFDAQMSTYNARSKKEGVDGTPSFLFIGPGGKKELLTGVISPGQFGDAVDKVSSK